MNDEVVLIVDDEPTNLTMLNKVLAGRYRIRAASSGERALQVAVTDPRPDLVLLDVEMPGMDGYQVLSRLKENQTTRGTPVIFVTSREAAEDEERGLGLGAVDYITKPIRPATIFFAPSRMFSFWQRGCRRTFDSATRSRITTSCCWADRHHCTISAKWVFPTVFYSSPASSRMMSG